MVVASELKQKLDERDFSRVRSRLKRDHNYNDDYIARMEEEYKKFIALCASSRTTGLGIARELDEFWHAHLMFTKDYESMCDQVKGSFIHHNPADEEESDGSRKQKVLVGYTKTYELYVNSFGDPPKEFWPLPNDASTRLDCSIWCLQCMTDCMD